MTLLYHTSVNQRLTANMVNCLLQSNLSEIWLRITGRKRIVIPSPISLLWELNSIFMLILRNKILLYRTPNMAAWSRGCKACISSIVVFCQAVFLVSSE